MDEIFDGTFFVAVRAFALVVEVNAWICWFSVHTGFIVFVYLLNCDIKKVEFLSSNFSGEVKN